MIDTSDNTVTVCMDYIKSRCSREKCKYFHPPAHLQAKIKSGQQQVNQAAVVAQAAAVAAMVRRTHSPVPVPVLRPDCRPVLVGALAVNVSLVLADGPRCRVRPLTSP
jgi:hypothetical protein